MAKMSDKLKGVVKTFLMWVLRSILLVLLCGLISGALGLTLFFVFLYNGFFPLSYVGITALRVLIYVLIFILYTLAFLAIGLVFGAYLVLYFGLERFIKNTHFLRILYKEVFGRLYEAMKGRGYIGTDDHKQHVGKTRVPYKETLLQMYGRVDSVFEGYSGGVFGAMLSPIKFATSFISKRVLKKCGLFMLLRMRKKERSGDYIILLDELEVVAKTGIWSFVKAYVLNPLLMFLLTSFAVFLAIITLPVALTNVLQMLLG
jgi:hypothetical protein